MRIYLLIAAIAGGVTWLVTPLIRHVAIHIGAVGEVRARDVHTIPTPRMGGLGMLIGFAFAMIYSSRIAFTTGLFENNNQEWVILAGAVLICRAGAMPGRPVGSGLDAEDGRAAADLGVRGVGRPADHIAAARLPDHRQPQYLGDDHRDTDRRVDQRGQFRRRLGRPRGGHRRHRRRRVRRVLLHHRAQFAVLRLDGDADRRGDGRHLRRVHPAQLASGQAVHGRLRLDAARVSHHLRVNRDDRPSGSGVDSCQRVPAGVHADPAADPGAVPASAGHVSGDRAPTQPRAVADAPGPYASCITACCASATPCRERC